MTNPMPRPFAFTSPPPLDPDCAFDAYALDAAAEMIADAIESLLFDDPAPALDDTSLARALSTDLLESSCFSPFHDISINMHEIALTAAIMLILPDCDQSDICADF